MCKKNVLQLGLIIGLLTSVIFTSNGFSQSGFEGMYIAGSGDTEYLELLDKACRMMHPDAELENLSMLYKTEWNGFVEGPTWNAWWIQNSFGPTYTMLPFMDKAYQSFVANSQALWFNQMGNDQRKDRNGYVAPKGSLCDVARPDMVIYRQGDGRHNIHDWGFGFTAAGFILQSEFLLITRDMESIREYLPLLEQCADFIDSRRDPEKNIFLVGTAGNLLAPSYAGSGKELEDGTYEMAYLAEISVNYIAGLDRLIELEKMAGRQDKVDLYQSRLEDVKKGLSLFLTDEGYFIRALEKDGTRHGVFGAPRYGYFEATPNHDAMAFRVVDDKQALKIYSKINSIPGLRPNRLILPNYPSYDDMYETKGLFSFGRWVNGGHWTTCEGRMQLGYYRVGAYDDAKEGFKKILDLCEVFKLDNPLPDFGAALYQPKLPVNCVYDSWGAPGGFLRGLFEYEYSAGGMRIYPHIPPGITQLQQKFPVYFGGKQIYIMTSGSGPLTSVLVNGKKIKDFDSKSVFLKMNSEAGLVFVSLGLGGQAAKKGFAVTEKKFQVPDDEEFWDIYKLLDEKEISADEVKADPDLRKVWRFYTSLEREKLTDTYEYKHAELILESIRSIYERRKLKENGKLVTLPPESQIAADELYTSTVKNLYSGLAGHLEKCRTSSSEKEQRIAGIWFVNKTK